MRQIETCFVVATIDKLDKPFKSNGMEFTGNNFPVAHKTPRERCSGNSSYFYVISNSGNHFWMSMNKDPQTQITNLIDVTLPFDSNTHAVLNHSDWQELLANTADFQPLDLT